MAKRNILQEAIADAKEVKRAAYDNAQNVLMEHLKDNMREFVTTQLNESLSEGESEQDLDESLEETQEVCAEGEGEFDMEDELDLEEMPEDEDDTDEDVDDLEEGLTEADLEEALAAALSEVTHGGLGDMEHIVNDGESGHPTGIEDFDSKEAGWEEKTAPKAKQHTLATGEKYQQESRALRSKVAKLVKENLMLKKANQKISETLKETKLFNAKLYYASQLMQKQGVTKPVKESILKKMDKVNSLQEAKNLYESLEIALGLLGEQPKAKSTGRSLTEALGSNNVSGTGKGINESVNHGKSDFVARNQKLAGITKE